MTDIVQRLRKSMPGSYREVVHEAADEIERLRSRAEKAERNWATGERDMDGLQDEIERLRAECANEADLAAMRLSTIERLKAELEAAKLLLREVDTVKALALLGERCEDLEQENARLKDELRPLLESAVLVFGKLAGEDEEEDEPRPN